MILFKLLAFQMTMLRQIRRHLAPTDYVQFGSSADEIGNYGGLITQQHIEASIRRNQRLVHDCLRRFDQDTVERESFCKEVLLMKFDCLNRRFTEEQSAPTRQGDDGQRF